jgi:hypothetical protein
MNLATWRDDPAVRDRREAGELDALDAELESRARAPQEAPGPRWQMRQLVISR